VILLAPPHVPEVCENTITDLVNQRTASHVIRQLAKHHNTAVLSRHVRTSLLCPRATTSQPPPNHPNSQHRLQLLCLPLLCLPLLCLPLLCLPLLCLPLLCLPAALRNKFYSCIFDSPGQYPTRAIAFALLSRWSFSELYLSLGCDEKFLTGLTGCMRYASYEPHRQKAPSSRHLSPVL